MRPIPQQPEGLIQVLEGDGGSHVSENDRFSLVFRLGVMDEVFHQGWPRQEKTWTDALAIQIVLGGDRGRQDLIWVDLKPLASNPCQDLRPWSAGNVGHEGVGNLFLAQAMNQFAGTGDQAIANVDRPIEVDQEPSNRGQNRSRLIVHADL